MKNKIIDPTTVETRQWRVSTNIGTNTNNISKKSNYKGLSSRREQKFLFPTKVRK